MGIRIHKALGWGLIDLKIKGNKIADPRIKGDVLTSDEFYDHKDSLSTKLIEELRTEQGMKHAQQVMSRVNICSPKEVKKYGCDFACACDLNFLIQKAAPNFKMMSDPFVHCSEYGMPRVMLISPIDYPQWQRYDDMIDYYESTEKNKVESLVKRAGIYPYVGWVRKPKSVAEEGMADRYDPAEYNMKVGWWDKSAKPTATGKELESLLRDYRPRIPASVIIYAERLGIFNNFEDTIQEFIPMLYTYWS